MCKHNQQHPELALPHAKLQKHVLEMQPKIRCLRASKRAENEQQEHH